MITLVLLLYLSSQYLRDDLILLNKYINLLIINKLQRNKNSNVNCVIS